jgi:multimeric flavodoxin WrbA
MSKIVVLNGSPRKNGSSRYLTELALEPLKAKGAEIKTWDLNTIPLNPCRGCEGCKGEKPTGRCVIKDEIADILDALRVCDALILSSPIYFGRFTAPSHLLLHRTYCMLAGIGPKAQFFYEPNEKRRMATVFTFGGGSVEEYKKEAAYFFGTLSLTIGIKEHRIVAAGGLHGKADVDAHPDYVKEAKDAGSWLAE